jgi:hypothetical protein
MYTHFKKLSLFLFILTFIFSCNGGKMEGKDIHYNSLNDIDTTLWKKLSQKKIYFGHKSVGNNIMAGIKDLLNENTKIKLNVVETDNSSDFNVGIFAHSKAGENSNPDSKINAFSKIMENGIGSQADIAFFKFCFVDIKSKTDIERLFNYYKDTMQKLRGKYPDTTFVHVTVPLTQLITNYKTWIKILIRKKEIWEYDNIVVQNRYNDLIRKEYKGKEPIFDLAEIESTYFNGKRSSFTRNGKIYYSLVPNFTNDGGHLNEKGRKLVAEQLLILLAKLN